MGKKKSKNMLWDAEGGTRAISKPVPVATSRDWTLPPEAIPIKPEAPRRLKVFRAKPNKRDAVAVPHPGQSYNPLDVDHQAALAAAVKKLKKKERANEKLIKAVTYTGKKIVGNFSADKTWEEEVQDKKPEKKKTKAVQIASEKKKKKKKKSMVAKKEAERAKKLSSRCRRHPHRVEPLKQLDKIADIEEYVAKKVAKRIERAAKKKIDRREGQKISTFGRYHHTPTVLDVAPTDKLVGSLRYLSGSYIHPAVERVKSLEERNLIPARMAHKFNRRKVLKPKGDVTIKREAFGILPEDQER